MRERLRESQDQVEAMNHSLQQVEVTEKSLTGKLRICKEQLAGNEQMIRWLNSQVIKPFPKLHASTALPSLCRENHMFMHTYLSALALVVCIHRIDKCVKSLW